MKILSVLVVEDNASIGVLLTETLENMGHQVCGVAATEADAIAAAAKYGPDLMIVDVQLADGSGLAAVDEICRSRPIPCVFMTGAAPSIGRPEAVVLRKPFHGRQLQRAIRDAMGLAPPV